MKFPRSFTRTVGEGPEKGRLRAEEGPERGPLDETAAAAALAADNVLVSRQSNTAGYPAQRIVVGWFGPEGGPPSPSATNAGFLDLAAWIFDHRTGCWFLMGEIGGAAERRVHVFDVPCLLDVPTVGRQTGQIAGPQALEVMIVAHPITNGRPVEKEYRAGVYTFAMGADVSNSP